MNRLLLLILTLMISIIPVMATNYYVDVDAVHGYSCSDTLNSGTSWSSPFCSIQKAADVVTTGSFVTVADGTYLDTDNDGNVIELSTSGNYTHRITFKSENKWGAVLDGGLVTNAGKKADGSWATSDGIYSSYVDYVTYDGFEIKNMRCHAMIIDDDNYIIIKNLYMHDIGQTYRKFDQWDQEHSGILGGINNLTLDSNIFHHIGHLHDTPMNWSDYNRDHGIYTAGNDNQVINNIFYNTESGFSIQITGGYRWLISNNIMYGKNDYEKGAIVFITQYSAIHDSIAQNNIIYRLPSESGYYDVSAGFDLWLYGDVENIQLINNIVYRPDGNITLVYQPYGDESQWSESNNILNQDPKFANVINKDFHLQSNSPAINNGTSINAPLYDFDGILRGSPPEIGAYEFGGIASPSITSYANNYSASTTFSVPSGTSVLFNATANQIVTNWTWTGANYISGNGTVNSNASHTFTEGGMVTVSGTNANGTSNTITWTVTIPVTYNTIGAGGANWAGNSTTDNTIPIRSTGNVELKLLINDYISYWRMDEKTGTVIHDENTTSNNSGNLVSTTWNTTRGIDTDGISGYIQIPDTNQKLANNTQTFIISSALRTGWVNEDLMVSKKNQYDSTTGWSQEYTTSTSFVFLGSGGSFTPISNTWGLDQKTHITTVAQGSTNALYIDGVLKGSVEIDSIVANNLNMRIARGSGYEGTYFTPLTVYYAYFFNRALNNTEINSTRDGLKYSSGNLTVWYNAGTGNETFKLWTNVTTPANTNYTVWYRQNNTGSFSQLGGTYTGNQSINITAKYQNTDVRLVLAGNTTATPEVISITLFPQGSTGTTFNQDVYNNGWQSVFINSTQAMTSIRTMMNSSNVLWITKWNAATQKWQIYKAGWNYNSVTTIDSGGAAYIKFLNNDTVVRNAGNGSYNWTLSSGWNLAGLDYPEAITLSQINVSVNTAACEVDKIVYTAPETRIEYTYTCGLTNNESIAVGPGEGMWLHLTVATMDKLRSW